MAKRKPKELPKNDFAITHYYNYIVNEGGKQ